MERIELNDESMESVTGGSICISPDLKTLGRNCNNQFKINNASAVRDFINKNSATMGDIDMLRAMLKEGYITKL